MIQGGKYKHISFLLRRGFAYTSVQFKVSLCKANMNRSPATLSDTRVS